MSLNFFLCLLGEGLMEDYCDRYDIGHFCLRGISMLTLTTRLLRCLMLLFENLFTLFWELCS